MGKQALRPLAVVPLGDLAAYVEFSRTLDLEVNALVQRLAAAVHALALPSIRDVVPALGGLALHFDPRYEGSCVESAAEIVDQCLKAGLPRSDDVLRTVQVPVCYEEEFAPDLKEVSARTKLKPGEIVELHSSGDYRVLMMGFAPGHAYMGGLHGKLAMPRRATPRASVPAGSVAIANEQTVVYPYAISGGWSVIGRTPLVVFDTERQEPSLFASGDRVRFRAIDKAEFMKLAEKR
jgi:KipI family sensor histidine kinase inhibitor